MKISNCVTCFFEKQGICLIKKTVKKNSNKDLNLLKVLCRDTQYSHSWLHCFLNQKRDFRLKPGTCNMNPQSINICWLESTPCDNEKKGIEVKSLKQDKQTGQLNKLKAPIVKQNVKKTFYFIMV